MLTLKTLVAFYKACGYKEAECLLRAYAYLALQAKSPIKEKKHD